MSHIETNLTQIALNDLVMTVHKRPGRGGGGEGGTPIKSGWVCAARGLKPLSYLRNSPMKIDTLFKAQIRKMTPYAREEQNLKIAWTGQLYFLSVRYLWQIICFPLNWVFTPCYFCWYKFRHNIAEKDTLFKDREPPNTIPYSAARTYIAHIGEYPPPG